MGYELRPFEVEDGERKEAEASKWLLRCLGVAAFAAMNIMLLSVAVWVGDEDIEPSTRDLFHGLSALIALPAAAFAGQPFFRSAFRALRARKLNMDVPISLGVLLALGMSVYETYHHAAHAYFDSATMLLAFLLLGRYLDQAMRRKTRAVAANLAALRTPIARLLKADGAQSLVPIAKVARGDLLMALPGERLAVDGVVVRGASSLDESVITGETTQRHVTTGDFVYGGSLNFEGALTFRAEAAPGGSLLDEIERMLDNATSARSKYVRLADRVSSYYAPVVHLAALATAIFWLWRGASFHDALIAAISVLIITCPCALALAVPAVQVVVSGALFRAGVLLNSADAIERFASVDTIVFDKTGTLTAPEPRLVNAAEIAPSMLDIAARLALSSSHPLAKAVARECRPRAPFEEAREEFGQGVVAIVDGREARLGSADFCGIERSELASSAPPGASVVALRHGAETALLLVRQKLRPDAIEVVSALARQGIAIEILSGDREESVEDVARVLNVRDWHGGLKPADKVARIEALRAAGRKVLMVGDGLNDAPSLAAAHASMSPIDATHLTQAAADAVFLGERLAPAPTTLAAARLAQRLMFQNLALSVIYNLVAVPLAMAGWLTPLIAAAAMSGSSVLVTLNALRASGGARSADLERPATSAALAALKKEPAI